MNKVRCRQLAAKRIEHIWAALSCLLFAVCSASAFAVPITDTGVNWSITLDEADRAGGPGSTLSFTGTISNGTGSDLLINDATLDFAASVPAPDYTFDFAPEFLDTLGIVPLAGYKGPLFFVVWSSVVPEGTTGAGALEVTIALPGDPSTLSVNFTAAITESPVPTPGSFELVFAGFVALFASRVRTCLQDVALSIASRISIEAVATAVCASRS
jgi:hypothetical protein